MEHYNDVKELLLQEIHKLSSVLDKKQANQLNLEQTARIVKRLALFAEQCDRCKEYLLSLQQSILALKANANADTSKSYESLTETIVAHLQQEHSLVSEGHYASTYMLFGVSIGLILGVLFSQIIGNFAYIGMGLPLGISVGLAIGVGLDEQAKKEGTVI